MRRAHVSNVAATIAVATAVVATVACSSSSSGGSVSVSQACSDLSSAICTKLQSCDPFFFSVIYADTTTCANVSKGPCADAVNANGSGANASNVEACAQGYMSATCAQLETNNPPTACQVHGSLAAGTACGSGVQCSGDSYCHIAANQVCGVCAALVGANGSCSQSSDCQRGLTCHTPSGSTTGTCVSPVAQGNACMAGGPACQTPLACVAGTCQQPVGMAGQKCDTTAQNCDLTQGLVCGTAGTCEKIAIASPGQPCGLLSGTYTVCQGSAQCNFSMGSTMGTCATTAANGATCGSNGEGCMAGATCVNNACTVPNASSCH
jgi:hypothetical protein